jgi:Fe-S-cluster containining protein
MQLPAGDQKLVQIMDRTLADAARRAGPWLACRVGCAQCCHGAFAVNALDAARLRSGMEALRTAEQERFQKVQQRAHAWIAAHGADFPGNTQTGVLGESEEEKEKFEDFANEAACPALDPQTGSCDLYAFRPMTCRVFGPPVRMEEGLGCCELCFVGASEEQIAACAMEVPHELEAELLAQIGSRDETVVAFALLR